MGETLTCTPTMASSTSRDEMARPRNMAATVRYLPMRGSIAAIMLDGEKSYKSAR